MQLNHVHQHQQMYFYYWGPLLCRIDIDDNLYNFISSCVNKPQQENNRFKHNVDKLEREYELTGNEKITFNELFSPYIMKYVEAHNKTWQPNAKPIQDEFVCANAWINFQGNNESRSLHTHVDSDISFVIYYDIPNILLEEASLAETDVVPGAVTFYNELPKPPEPLFKNIKLISHMPKMKEAFIFPSSLPHMVNSFKSECTRISIAGNYIRK